MENPMKTHNFKKPRKAKGMSFFAFLFSVVIYISIFYIFSLSPSTLLNNTKFWFAISNTLIIIIAADYGSFSSQSKEKNDVYEEYALHSQAAASSRAAAAAAAYSSSSSSLISEQSEAVKKSIDPKEEGILMVPYQKNESEITTPEKILEVVNNEVEDYPTDKMEAKIRQQPVADDDERQVVVDKNTVGEVKAIRRSKSDKVKPDDTFHDKNILKRSETEKLEPNYIIENDSSSDQENEFSTMSDEELNRRVEEFIQNFNRQIRLQPRN